MTAWSSAEERQEGNAVEKEKEERKGRKPLWEGGREGGAFPQNHRDAWALMSGGNYGGVSRSPTEGMLSDSKGLRGSQ